MQWQLKRIEKDRPSPITPIRSGRLTIGRGPECDFALADNGISRRHCVITARGDGLWIEDEKSRNGTSVNCQPIQTKTELSPGDAIRIGPYLFLVLQGEEGADETVADVPREQLATLFDASTDWDGTQTVRLA